MIHALCPSDCWKVKWQSIGAGVSCLMLVIILMNFPPQSSRSTAIHSQHCPCKTPFLPITMPALGQGLQDLVVNSLSQGPTLHDHCIPSLLYRTSPTEYKTTALGSDETVNQMSATAMMALDRAGREDISSTYMFCLRHFNHLDGHHGDHPHQCLDV